MQQESSMQYLTFLLLLTSVKGSISVAKHASSQEPCTADDCHGQNKYTHTNYGKPKKILYWTHFYGHTDFEFGFGRKAFVDAGCHMTNCEATADKSKSDEADALLFHMRNVIKDTRYPRTRHAQQKYVFFLMEHPYHQWNDLTKFNGFFNLTMTYRLDSDVPILYGRTIRRSEKPTRQELDMRREKIKRKSKKVAWFVSNCQAKSRREDYAKELQKYIDVDIYGKCGPLKCPSHRVRDARMVKECYEMLEKEYKFYLSFENAFCKDYVTEKVFNILGYDVVPVVMGQVNYSAILPEGSFIDAMQYRSPKDLGDYLNYLDKTPAEYEKYFQWKEQYKVLNYTEAFKEGFCKLCEVLNEDHMNQSKVHTDIDGWWGKTKFCDNQRMLREQAKWDGR